MAAGRGHFLVRSGDWKLITGPGSGGFSKIERVILKTLPKVQLYNLKEDLGETNNLAAKHPEKVAELQGLLEKIRNDQL